MTSTPVFGSERTFALEHAILIYKERSRDYISNDVCAATIHDVETDPNKDGKPGAAWNEVPRLGPGQPVTLASLEALALGLGRKLENCLLPENILAVSLSLMAWWCPAGRRRIWFNPNDTGKTSHALKKLNGKVVAHPPLLFVANGGFSIFALAENRRPALSTKLFRAPYYNLSPGGAMCEGNVKVPKGSTPNLIPEYQKAFFDSSFSHSNWGHQLTRFPGGHLPLWQAMVAAKTFPTKWLISINSTLKSILSPK